MSRFLITNFIVSLLVFVLPQDQDRVKFSNDPQKKETTMSLPSTRLSGPKDRYHNLTFSIYYSYPTMFPAPPDAVNFEIVSVVKARKLNTDLYVVFVVDGKEIHFSSNRSAIPKPVAGKRWIGERMIFLIPYPEFRTMAAAKTLGVKLGGVNFDFDDEMQTSIKAIARRMLLTVTN